mmetsp:Transcript_38015/g.87872  ORF Transcript_38015/g.87872 Transcript_38015/m.87872 type:complete len:210 (+) Transcript_38015:370-999(+)
MLPRTSASRAANSSFSRWSWLSCSTSSLLSNGSSFVASLSSNLTFTSDSSAMACLTSACSARCSLVRCATASYLSSAAFLVCSAVLALVALSCWSSVHNFVVLSKVWFSSLSCSQAASVRQLSSLLCLASSSRVAMVFICACISAFPFSMISMSFLTASLMLASVELRTSASSPAKASLSSFNALIWSSTYAFVAIVSTSIQDSASLLG